jgi:hypothetical protein
MRLIFLNTGVDFVTFVVARAVTQTIWETFAGVPGRVLFSL